MTLNTMPPRRPVRSDDGSDAVRRTGYVRARSERRGLPSRSLIVALTLSCVTLMVVDKAGGESSPVEPVRRAVGEVFGPIQAGVDTAVGPIFDLPGGLRTNGNLRDQISDLEAENAALAGRLAKAGYDDRRLAELDGLRAMAGDLGYALLPARVVSIGAAQSFTATVTIDAGSSSGLHPDMTVLNGDGLVGRITRVSSHTATVRLIADQGSTVGGRLGDDLELGFVHGTGATNDEGTLDLELTDNMVVPRKGQLVLTWGSEGGAPYVAGVPIGTIDRVFESVRETSYRAVIRPAVDFTALDLVAVVVPSGTGGRVIEADGSLRDGGRR